MLEILEHFDQSAFQNKKGIERYKILKFIFLTECKYNLDVLAVIKFDKIETDDAQLRRIVNLLSFAAIKRLLLESQNEKEGSFLLDMFKNISSKMLGNYGAERISENDPFILNLYKRIKVLKALSTIEPPYTIISEIDFKKRLENLKAVLLQIIQKNETKLKDEALNPAKSQTR